MGLGALGILGGVGKGVMIGADETRRQKESAQLQQLRQYQIDRESTAKKMRDEEQAAYDSSDDSSTGIQKASQSAADNVNAQAGANAAMAAGIGNAIKSGVSQSALAGSNPGTPTLSQLAAPTSTGAPLAGTQPDATGIQAAADNATGAAVPNGSSNLADSNPASTKQVATPLNAQQSYTKSWADRAQKLAAIHDRYGDHAGADAILKSANDRSMAMYDQQFRSAMQDYYGGNLDSAAAKLSTLYNLTNPAGTFADYKNNGDGTFTVTTYDKDGKASAPQKIGQQQIEQLAQTTMNPAEMAKMLMQQRHDESQQAIWLGRNTTSRANNQDTNQTRIATNANTNSTRVATNTNTEEHKDSRATAGNASRESIGAGHDTARVGAAEVTAGAKGAGAADKSAAADAKAVGDEIDKMTKGADLTYNADQLAQLQALGEANLKSGMTPRAAALNAWQKFQQADADATDQATEAAKGVKNGLTEFGTTGLEARGDPQIVRQLKSQGKLNVANYQAALQKKLRTQKLGSAAAPAAAPAASSKPQALPKSKNDLVAGTVYQTARGPATWNGTAFTK